LPDNAVAITIDDGFHSTCKVAAPILKACGFPATVYVTSYYVQKKTPIYRLFVQYALWKTSAIKLRESDVLGEFGGEVDLTNAMEVDRATWRFIEYGEMRSSEEQAAISKRLGAALGVPYSAIKLSRTLTLMTEREIGGLRDYGIDVQLHTHRHRLPFDRESVLREINDNRSALRTASGAVLEHLCYPSGEWSPRHWPWLREAGITTATTCDYGLNSAATNTLALMRFVDGENVSMVEFDAAISGFAEWLHAIKETASSVKRFIRAAERSSAADSVD
jgi:peptidoglycan/xylan/chitin deacetylase (PgdA/CDA1 family)